MFVSAACRVAFNLAILFLLMRIWPLGGRSSGGLIPDSPDSVVVTVPFSEFVHRARTNEVQTARWACTGCWPCVCRYAGVQAGNAGHSGVWGVWGGGRGVSARLLTV
jgi:hypothetical protein